MRFTKWNNPNKRRKNRVNFYSKEYCEERRKVLYKELANCETEEQRDALIKAYNISTNPVRW